MTREEIKLALRASRTPVTKLAYVEPEEDTTQEEWNIISKHIGHIAGLGLAFRRTDLGYRMNSLCLGKKVSA